MAATTEDYPVLAENDLYVIHELPYGTEWMTGDITGFDTTDPAELAYRKAELARAALGSLGTVQAVQMEAATCADGRRRLMAADGSPLPLRRPLTGSNSVNGFVIAETLGGDFYPDPDAPFVDRMAYVTDFMTGNGQIVTTHESCGAGNGFVAVQPNIVRFAQDPSFAGNVAANLPAGGFDRRLFNGVVDGVHRRYEAGRYDDYDSHVIGRIVIARGGPVVYEKYDDDGRGVHGHLEKARLILDEAVADVTVAPNRLADTTGADQLFVSSGSKQTELAGMFSNGGQNELFYLRALHAVAAFGTAGLGTLARNQPLWRLSKKAA